MMSPSQTIYNHTLGQVSILAGMVIMSEIYTESSDHSLESCENDLRVRELSNEVGRMMTLTGMDSISERDRMWKVRCAVANVLEMFARRLRGS